VSLSTQMSRSEDIDDTIRQRSGWLIPVGVFAVTAVLSAMVLLFYLAPTPQSFIEEHPAPTSRTDPVHITVNGVAFTIPALQERAPGWPSAACRSRGDTSGLAGLQRLGKSEFRRR